MIAQDLTHDNQQILKYVRLDYFWDQIPFNRLQTALDVGGHVGLWSHVCQQHAPHMTITAIEAHPDNYAQLVENCPTITALHGWCGYQEDVVGLCVRPLMEGSHYVIQAGESPATGGWIVPLPVRVTLEDFGPIDLLKLDCEGSEFDILTHCEEATLRRIQVIVGEYHLERGSLSTIVNRLSDCFAMTIVPHTTAPHLGHFLALRKSV
jgi:FkbM family methyltransferase